MTFFDGHLKWFNWQMLKPLFYYFTLKNKYFLKTNLTQHKEYQNTNVMKN
jgi:hypothetical protein